jgi:hypothetical protein
MEHDHFATIVSHNPVLIIGNGQAILRHIVRLWFPKHPISLGHLEEERRPPPGTTQRHGLAMLKRYGEI